MAINDAWSEVKDRVREAADIVQVIGECVKLNKAGNRFSGLCPFHGEKTPSFSVNPQEQFFHCFGCQESGDVFSFMMKYHHLTFPEALKDLAQRYQIDLPERNMSDADRERMRRREELYLVNREAASIYHTFLISSDKAGAARKYLRDRGVPPEVLEKYQLGYAPAPEKEGWKFMTSRLQRKKISAEAVEQAGLAVQNKRGEHYDRFRDRVLFPIYNMSGREVAFGGRILADGKPKYMNSPESMIFSKSRLLFGLYQHRQAIRKSRRAIVVEGNFDLLLLAVHGIDNVVAPLGTALTREHIKSLRSYCDEVVLLFDGDSAGLKAARRSIPFFLSEQVEGRVALLPQGHDPDSLVREKGAEGIQELIDTAAPLAEFVFSALVKEHSLTLSGKNRIIAELTDLVREAADPSQRELMAAHFAEQLGIAPARFLIGKVEPNRAKHIPARHKEQGVIQETGWDMMHPGMPPDPPDTADMMPDMMFDASSKTEAIPSFLHLPKKQREMLDFLVLYPEFLAELLAGGLRESVRDPSFLAIIDSMEQLAVTKPDMPEPEQLLSVLSTPLERKYIADLLIKGTVITANTKEKQERDLCDELLIWLKEVWLKEVKKKRTGRGCRNR